MHSFETDVKLKLLDCTFCWYQKYIRITKLTLCYSRAGHIYVYFKMFKYTLILFLKKKRVTVFLQPNKKKKPKQTHLKSTLLHRKLLMCHSHTCTMTSSWQCSHLSPWTALLKSLTAQPAIFCLFFYFSFFSFFSLPFFTSRTYKLNKSKATMKNKTKQKPLL